MCLSYLRNMFKFMASYMIQILFLGWVTLAASSTKVYRIIDDGTHPLESHNSGTSQASNHNRFLENIINRLKNIKSNLLKSEEDSDIYDYNGYFMKKANRQDKNKNCKGANCMFLIPGKAPWVLTDNKDTSRFRNGKINQYTKELESDKDSGYERDDEGENIETPIMRSNDCDCKKKSNPCQKKKECKSNALRATTKAPPTTTARKRIVIRYHHINKTTPRKKRFNFKIIYHHINTTTKPTTTTTRRKTFDEKTTAEITSADLDMYIPDSFEPEFEVDRRTPDYLDVDYLLRTYVKNNKTGRESNSPVLESAVKPTTTTNKQATNKELLKSLRTNAENLYYNYKKWAETMKNKASKDKVKKYPVQGDSESERENDSSLPREKSLEYQIKTKKSKYQKNIETNNQQKRIIPNIFDIVDTLNTYGSDSGEPKRVVLQKDSTETREPFSVEVVKKKLTSGIPVDLSDSSDTSSFEAHESHEANNRIRFLEELISRMQEIQSNLPDNKDYNDYTFKDRDDYDYDGYYLGNVDDKHQNCKGANCLLLISGKVPMAITDDKGTAKYRIEKINSYKDKRKFSTDYFDVDLLRSLIKKNDTAGYLPKQAINKELLRNLRTNPALNDDSKKWVRMGKIKASREKANKLQSNSENDSENDSENKSENDSNRNWVTNKKNKASQGKSNKKWQLSENNGDSENHSSNKWEKSKTSREKANKKSKLKERDSNSENDSNTSQEKSSEYKKTKYQKENNAKSQKKKKPSRFDILNSLNAYTSDSGEPRKLVLQKDSTETIERISDEVKPTKKSKPRIPGKPEHYMQGPSRLYKEGSDFRKKKEIAHLAKLMRKRMPHFLPKRYHWDPSEYHKLGYYWFNGPQGKVPGPWKISY